MGREAANYQSVSLSHQPQITSDPSLTPHLYRPVASQPETLSPTDQLPSQPKDETVQTTERCAFPPPPLAFFNQQGTRLILCFLVPVGYATMKTAEANAGTAAAPERSEEGLVRMDDLETDDDHEAGEKADGGEQGEKTDMREEEDEDE